MVAWFTRANPQRQLTVHQQGTGAGGINADSTCFRPGFPRKSIAAFLALLVSPTKPGPRGGRDKSKLTGG